VLIIKEPAEVSQRFYKIGMKTMIMHKLKKELQPEQLEKLLEVLKARFENNMNRHKGLEWAKIQARLEANSEKMWSLNEMERTGGEPDVVGYYKKTD
jgi:phosphate-selective porin